jgi:hypothetical protein
VELVGPADIIARMNGRRGAQRRIFSRLRFCEDCPGSGSSARSLE